MMVGGKEILELIERKHKLIPVERRTPAETAMRFGFADSTAEIGIIAPVTMPFCGQCNRIRVTADGKVRNCLFSRFRISFSISSTVCPCSPSTTPPTLLVANEKAQTGPPYPISSWPSPNRRAGRSTASSARPARDVSDKVLRYREQMTLRPRKHIPL